MEVHTFLTNLTPRLPYGKAAEVAEVYQTRNVQWAKNLLGSIDGAVDSVAKEFELMREDLEMVAMLE